MEHSALCWWVTTWVRSRSYSGGGWVRASSSSNVYYAVWRLGCVEQGYRSPGVRCSPLATRRTQLAGRGMGALPDRRCSRRRPRSACGWLGPSVHRGEPLLTGTR